MAEPIVNQPLEHVSFAKLLGQLLAMGRTFDMSLQPDLFLLQKNMLMAEGIARSLSPDINIWDIARPLVRDWMIEYRNPVAQLSWHAETALAAAGRLPSMLEAGRKCAQGSERRNEPPPLGGVGLAGFRAGGGRRRRADVAGSAGDGRLDMALAGKQILLIVSGGIAAYKAAVLVGG